VAGWSGGDVFETAEERSCHFWHLISSLYVFLDGLPKKKKKFARQEPDTRVRPWLG
jgi:hypothetical protein